MDENIFIEQVGLLVESIDAAAYAIHDLRKEVKRLREVEAGALIVMAMKMPIGATLFLADDHEDLKHKAACFLQGMGYRFWQDFLKEKQVGDEPGK